MSIWQNGFGKAFRNVTVGLLRKKSLKNDVNGRDRHNTEKRHVKKTAVVSAGKKAFSRRFYYLGGLYLLTVVVLLAVVFLRMGMIPAPEIPGMDKDWTGVQSDDQIGDVTMGKEAGSLLPVEDSDSSAVAIDINSNTDTNTDTNMVTGSMSETSAGNLPGDSSPDSVGEGFESSSQDLLSSGEDNPESLDLFPETGEFSLNPGDGSTTDAAVEVSPALPPASPLPDWYLYVAYGDYNSEVLPSGGMLHHRTRGVLLAGTPGASVSALWDGTVVTAGEKNFPFGCFVILEHEDGYRTLYGNLREIWVKEGEQVNRGENIGLLASAPSARNMTSAGFSGDKNDAANVNTSDSNPLNSVPDSGKAVYASGMLPFQTVMSGFEDGEVRKFLIEDDQWEEINPETDREILAAFGAQPGTGAVGKGEKEEKAGMYSAFDGENPLLYLELRRDNQYIDPLLFINERN